jgi:hypothetical protein
MLLDRLTEDRYPLVVLTRTGNAIAEKALRRDIITIICCEADVDLVSDQGMPQYTDRLYPVEEGIAEQLQELAVGAYHIASITGDGLRRIVLAHPVPIEFEPILGRFNPDGYSLSATNLDNREKLIDLVTPTQMERQLDGDRRVISNLERNGDDGVTPRRTDFWFYGERGRLTQLVEELAPWGYAIDRWLQDPEGVVVFSETPVDYETFREVTPVLVGAAERHGVEYDGWETFVARPDVPQPEPSPASESRSLLSRLFGAKN